MKVVKKIGTILWIIFVIFVIIEVIAWQFYVFHVNKDENFFIRGGTLYKIVDVVDDETVSTKDVFGDVLYDTTVVKIDSVNDMIKYW